MKKRLLIVLTAVLAFTASFLGVFYLTGQTGVQAIAPASGTDWPMFMGDAQRTGANTAETVITAQTASRLAPAWQFTTGNKMYASPVIVNNVVYVGSWDGYEYAIDASTHQQIWRTYLGVTNQTKSCYNPVVGITSTAAVQNNVAYVGGGDGYLYALNTADGSVLWKHFLGSPPYYNWSSPLLDNNKVYIGLAAFCDPPFAQGKVIALNESDGSLAASVSLVPDGQTGATVWSSPALDASSGLIYVSTGNNGSQVLKRQPDAEAILALDPNTLNVVDSWQLPKADQISDADFGATPTLFDVNGVGYIGVLNKNGVYYVLNRAHLSAGPVWRQILSGSPFQDGHNVSSSCFSNGVIYAGAGIVTGAHAGGSVHAFDAATGTPIWSFNTTGGMVSSIFCTSDLVVDSQGTTVEVRAASNGNILFQYSTGKFIRATSTICNGVLYVPAAGGTLYAFMVH